MEPRRVGVRELRQNLSMYLRRVASGEQLQVTERGKPVAILAPLPETTTATGRLVASGRGRPPSAELMDLPAPTGPVTTKGSDALQELRGERL